jgi:hypothetical protein
MGDTFESAQVIIKREHAHNPINRADFCTKNAAGFTVNRSVHGGRWVHVRVNGPHFNSRDLRQAAAFFILLAEDLEAYAKDLEADAKETRDGD